MTDSLYGFDLVVTDKAGQTIGLIPVVMDGDNDRAALARLRLRQPNVNGLPTGAAITSVQHHVAHLGHLFADPNSPLFVKGWRPFAGPAVPIAQAREALSHTVAVTKLTV
jgi:hypothetical protein